MIKFFIGGRSIDPSNIKDAMEAAILKGLRAQISEKIGAIRDPDTGEFPTVVVRGDNLDKLRIHVEGSPNLVALVKERLGLGADDVEQQESVPKRTPRVFLSYTSEDSDLARRLAEGLEAAGVSTWWDRWCIYPGDSLRQKIDEGLGECTHFVVLLTPRSIKKPWVNQEMDAGLVRKLNDQCRFLPIRHELPASELPPLLAGIHSPTVGSDQDIEQLINDIYEVTRKPAQKRLPTVVRASAEAQTGYSPAATAVARLFVERSQDGLFADPQFEIGELAAAVGLSEEDVSDALFELTGYFTNSHRHWLVKSSLFTQFDRHWKPWNPADDALRLAADIMNDHEFPADCGIIAERYGWEARRLNPAIQHLLERDLLVDYQGIGTSPWLMHRIVGRAAQLRRFLKSRS